MTEVLPCFKTLRCDHTLTPVVTPTRVLRCSCTVDNTTAAEKGLQFVHEGHPCREMRHPEPIGLVQATPLTRRPATAHRRL